MPNIIGVFHTSEGLANMAMEPPHPHAWRVADRSLSTNEKRGIVEAYAEIHARGVLHRDVALRHMLIGTFGLSKIAFALRFEAGRDGKATIINFRQASCLPPVNRIGLSGCGAHDFQLEMRQVKFLLDYQGAREFEYRLAREHFYAMRTSSRAGITSSSLVRLDLYDSISMIDVDLCALISSLSLRIPFDCGMPAPLKSSIPRHSLLMFQTPRVSRYNPYLGFQKSGHPVWMT